VQHVPGRRSFLRTGSRVPAQKLPWGVAAVCKKFGLKSQQSPRESGLHLDTCRLNSIEKLFATVVDRPNAGKLEISLGNDRP